MPSPRRVFHAEIICQVCGEKFLWLVRGDREPARFCSRSCIWRATKGPEYNAALAREHNPPRNRAARGTGTKGYVKRDGRHEHRLVAEEKIGRKLMPGEIVHHIDGNKHNNDPDNLLVMTQRKHMREHGLGIPGVRPAHEPWKARWKR